MSKYQVVLNTGCNWVDDFEGGELCLFQTEEDAIECCHDMARIHQSPQDNWGYVKTNEIGEWDEFNIELITR